MAVPQALAENPKISAVSFVGSSRVAESRRVLNPTLFAGFEVNKGRMVASKPPGKQYTYCIPTVYMVPSSDRVPPMVWSPLAPGH